MDIFSSVEWMSLTKSMLFLALLGAAWIWLTRRQRASFGAGTRTLAIREQLLLTRDTRIVVITRGAAHEWVLAVGPQGMQLLAVGGRADSKRESFTSLSHLSSLTRATSARRISHHSGSLPTLRQGGAS